MIDLASENVGIKHASCQRCKAILNGGRSYRFGVTNISTGGEMTFCNEVCLYDYVTIHKFKFDGGRPLEHSIWKSA